MYTCEFCNYETTRKYDFERHNSSERHKYQINMKRPFQKVNNDNTNLSNYECNICGKNYMYKSGLSRHKALDHIDNKKTGVLTEEFMQIKALIEKQQQEIDGQKREIEALKQKPSVVNKYTTNYNYIQQNYGNAKPLRAVEYGYLTHDNEYDLVRDLEHHFNHNKLDTYLGDFIVQNYKKENVAEQSMWNIDKSRHNYSVRSRLDDETDVWLNDGEATRVTKTIIKPMQEKLESYIKKEIGQLTKRVYEKDGIDCETEFERQNILSCIQTELKNNELAKNIIKRITPWFHLDQSPQIKV
jgi:hypothetical protein